MATMAQSVRDGEGERCACAFGCVARARAT